MTVAATALRRGWDADEVVPGDPEGLERVAAQFLGYTDVLFDAAAALGRVETEWAGDAARSFWGRFTQEPGRFRAAARAFDDSAAALRRYAESVRSARAEARTAIQWWREGMAAARDQALAAAGQGDIAAGVGVGLDDDAWLSLSAPGAELRASAVSKLDSALASVEWAGDAAAEALLRAQEDAPEAPHWWQSAAPALVGLTQIGDSAAKREVAAGAGRGLVDLLPLGGRQDVTAVLNGALDEWERQHGLDPDSGVHAVGRLVGPMMVPLPGLGAAGFLVRVAARWGGGAARVGRALAEGLAHDGAERVVVGARGLSQATRSLVGEVTRLTPEELATGNRLANHPGFLDRTFAESPHEGAEFIDDLGRSYDALGAPGASLHWNESRLLRAIDKHLLKSNDFTVIDLTSFTPDQITTVKAYVDALPKTAQARIIRMGF